MANGDDDPRVYQALALPEKALEDGGVEILRLGIIKDELYVSALPAFTAPSQWGEVLAEVAERLGAIYAAQNTALDQKDVIVQIAEAFVSETGAQPVKAQAKQKAKQKAKAKASAAKSTPKKPAARPAARRKKR
jgi:hypothetical protein